MSERDPTVALRYAVEEIVLNELRTAVEPCFRNELVMQEHAYNIACQVLQRLADLNIELRR